jgi:hypothetical protein
MLPRGDTFLSIAKRVLAADQEPETSVGPEHILSIVVAALSKFNPPDKQKLCAGLTRIIQAGGSDAPSAFGGMPRPGGGMDPVRTPAQDKAFYDRHPYLRVVGHW